MLQSVKTLTSWFGSENKITFDLNFAFLITIATECECLVPSVIRPYGCAYQKINMKVYYVWGTLNSDKKILFWRKLTFSMNIHIGNVICPVWSVSLSFLTDPVSLSFLTPPIYMYGLVAYQGNLNLTEQSKLIRAI